VSDAVRFGPVNERNGQDDQKVGNGHADEEHDVEVAMSGHEILEPHSGCEPQDDKHREVQTHRIDHQGRKWAENPQTCIDKHEQTCLSDCEG